MRVIVKPSGRPVVRTGAKANGRPIVRKGDTPSNKMSVRGRRASGCGACKR